MKVEYRNFKDFESLMTRHPEKHGKKVSLILPARDEYATIGNYFPTFAGMMENGCIDEVVIADNSDDSRTIDAALESAMSTEPFRKKMDKAIHEESSLPVKAVSVFDSELAGIFNGHKPTIGVTPGKGTAMYLGMAVATGDVLVFLDTDFNNIDPRFVYGLVGPFENPKTELVKATFEIEDNYTGVIEECKRRGESVEDCELLMKSAVTRVLAKPLMAVLDKDLEICPTISDFSGPISGGCAASREAWHSIMVPTHYGVDVSYLMQFVRNFDSRAIAYDVNLGEVVQESQDKHGLTKMSNNIINTIAHHLRLFGVAEYERFKEDPELLVVKYIERANELAAHRTDVIRILHNATSIRDVVASESFDDLKILPPLGRNIYYQDRKQKIINNADRLTYLRLIKNEKSAQFAPQSMIVGLP